MTSTEQKSQDYFDLHTTGIGYLNRYRTVSSEGGDYVGVTIAALQGRCDKSKKVYFDTVISGADAKDLADKYQDLINDRDVQVFVRFKIDGVTPRTFTFKNGKRAGETGIELKSRLIRLYWIKIKRKGETSFREVYKAEPAVSPDAASESAQQAA